MFKKFIIEAALAHLLAFLESPKGGALKEFLLSDATQRTMADIYARYVQFTEEAE